jgi:hypothetical protein
MNLDIFICVIENTPEDDLQLLQRLRQTCQAAFKHVACRNAFRRAGLLACVQKSREAVILHAESMVAQQRHQNDLCKEANRKLSFTHGCARAVEARRSTAASLASVMTGDLIS